MWLFLSIKGREDHRSLEHERQAWFGCIRHIKTVALPDLSHVQESRLRNV